MKNPLVSLPSALIIFIAITLILYRSPMGLGDWPLFHNASRAILNGGNPYLTQVSVGETTLCIYNPPWVLTITMPFSFLTLRLGWAMLNATSFISILFVARRLGASYFVLLVSIPVIYRAIWTGNVDGFSLLGAALPAPIGVFFAALKPQNTVGLMIYWAFWNWKLGRLRRLIFIFAPATVALAISFVVFTPWLTLGCPFSTTGHLALFPTGVPFGLAILMIAIASKRKYLALAASPFISPYISYASIVLLTLWGLFLLQDFSVWLYRVGTLSLEWLIDRRHRSTIELYTH